MTMHQPDYEAARRYALARLERELDPRLCYHSVAHTRDHVLPATERLAASEGVAGDDLLLLRTAALYHDLGFLVARAGHEEASVALAAAALPSYGYTPEHVARIGDLIRATRLPQSPRSPLERVLADADLDLLGREDFFQRNRELREELRAFGESSTDAAWYESQIAFMTAHRYWTDAAHSLRAGRKQEHLAALRARLLAVASG